MPIVLTDDMRRLIAEARERRINELAGIDGTDPFANIPGQSAPRQVSYWEAGKLYQPGDLVQANNLGDIAQAPLTNDDFESGDTGWTKGTDFTIENTAGFDGSWRAEYAGQVSARLHVPYDDSGARVASTDLVGASDNDAFTGDGMLVAANSTVVVAVGRDGGDSVAERSLDGGLTWAAASVVPWDIFDRDFSNCWWDEQTSLFYVWNDQTLYWTSPDGDTWTARTFTGTNVGATEMGHINYNGKLYIYFGTRIYSTADGITWTLEASAPGPTFNTGQIGSIGSTYYNITNNGSGDVDVWTSTDAVTWTIDNTASTNLQAVFSDVNNGVWLASDGSRLVVGVDNTTSSADNIAFSTDGSTWSAASTATQGTYLRYAPGVAKFVKVEDSTADVIIEHSEDGDTWSTYTMTSGFGNREFPAGWPVGASISTAFETCINDDRATSFPGQIVTATAKVQTSATGTAKLGIAWYNSGGSLIKITYGDTLTGASSNWREIDVAAVAPLDAATCSVALAANGAGTVFFDTVQWDHYTIEGKSSLIFEATQAAAGHSDESEPTWPVSVGLTVVDNEVTWTARAANCIVWEAKPILLSGSSEPTFPTEEGGTVVDNTILWTADSGRVKDVNCPNTKYVRIASSKVFCGDDDIVAFSATVNPLDWSSPDDAGFIPFGLNTYGAEPVRALGIYRSNLVIWNSQAFQMWQVDEDPQNFAILDAVPVGNRFYKSHSPVSNDLVWLTDEGIRNMGIAGASTNLQAGFFGKQIDPLVKAQIDAIADEDDILSLYYPGQGQYWIIFDDEAFVLTMNGGKQDMSWSRYTFPSDIDDYTIKDGDLYLRSGDKVWLFDPDAVQDDVGGTPSNFEGRVWWHYLDFGALGITKSMIGFDVVASGTFNVAIGYDQSNTATATTDYELTGDTLPNGVIPLPVTAPSFQFRLTWAGGEAWEWFGSALYLQDWRITS